MTKRKKASVLVSAVVLGTFVGASPLFAAGRSISMSSSVSASNADYLAITVEAPEAAKDYLVSRGANAATISDDLAAMPVADRNKIRQIYSHNDDPDYREELNAIVYKALEKYLVPGKAETVTAAIGPCRWTVSYNVPGIYYEGAEPSAD